MVDGPPTNTGHETHDELLIATLLDPDLSEDERAPAESLVATCPDCARLLADLVALSKASATRPLPARTRDFRLTAADVARLTANVAGEPRPSIGRLSGDMQHPMTNHATHDELLVAGLLDRSTTNPDRTRAESLIASCHDCASLHRDLVALRAATQAMPTPTRPRDFSLSLDDVERLRPRGWRRVIAAIGSSGDIFSRPLAIGLTTLGLAALLVATIPAALSGQAGAAPAVLSTVGSAVGGGDANPGSLGASRESAATAGPSSAAAAAPAPAASAEPSAAAAALLAPSSEPPVGHAPLAPSLEPVPSSSAEASSDAAAIAPKSAESTSEPQDAYGTTSAASTPGELPAERPGLVVVAILLLVLGLGLFGLRWSARRLGSA